jgi:predicted nuclease with TOPRIM domain
MPDFPEKLTQFKDKLDLKLDRITGELDRLKDQIQHLETEWESANDQLNKDLISKRIRRTKELHAIQRDHKDRLEAEVLRIGSRNPGLLRPDHI